MFVYVRKELLVTKFNGLRLGDTRQFFAPSMHTRQRVFLRRCRRKPGTKPLRVCRWWSGSTTITWTQGLISSTILLFGNSQTGTAKLGYFARNAAVGACSATSRTWTHQAKKWSRSRASISGGSSNICSGSTRVRLQPWKIWNGCAGQDGRRWKRASGTASMCLVGSHIQRQRSLAAAGLPIASVRRAKSTGKNLAR